MQRVREFWLAQAQAEYASAAITTQYVHWLQRVAASPDLIKQGLRISDDEMVHAELASSIAQLAGAAEAPQIDDMQLNPVEAYSSLHKCIFQRNLQFYCLGETVAIPLFQAMLENAEIDEVITSYQRILKDEGRHSDYGWLNLAWMIENWPIAEEWLVELLPSALMSLQNEYIADSLDDDLSDKERAWGMISNQQYYDIFQRTLGSRYQKQLSIYGVDMTKVFSK